MSRLSGQVYDQTKSADLSETQADPTGLCRRPGHRHGSPDKVWSGPCSGIWPLLHFVPVLMQNGVPLEVVESAMENKVHLMCLPPHCSHLLQPLDVGIFKPLKDEWQRIVKQWYKECRMKHVDKAQFNKLVKKTLRQT